MRIIETESLQFTNGLTENEREWIYNGFDACVTHEVRDKLITYLDPVSRATYDFSLSLQAPIMEMSLRGILVDQNQRLRLLTAVRKDTEFLEARLRELLIDGVGMDPSIPARIWASSHQLKHLFYKIIGLPPVMKRGPRGERVPTVDRNALEKLSWTFIAEPICRHILILRDLEKKRQFLETGIDADNRYRSGFNIAGTNTGRLSSSGDDFGTGGNSQNVGRSLRSIFVADSGYKLANLDLEQADSRNVGALCWNLFHEIMGDSAGKYLDACESGDLHTTVCRMANPQLPWPEEQKAWRKVADEIAYRDFTYRDLAKRLGHGTNYYGTPPTMSKHTKVPVGQVKDFQHAYFLGFPEIPRYHVWVKEQLLSSAQITTLFGRRRFFFGRPKDDATIREAIAYAPQSMTAEEINIGLLKIWRARKVQLLTQVHDSILFQYPEHLEDEIIPWALETLKAPLELTAGRHFCVPTEAKVGWNWGDVEYNKDGSVKDNPDGLIKYKGHDTRKRTSSPRLSLRNF